MREAEVLLAASKTNFKKDASLLRWSRRPVTPVKNEIAREISVNLA